ncbi:hypothetical protein ABEB36_007509 [Hypothenemus hampei]|uniref:Uncharacterized protein n=1 Tax=Hypothenemus hampei TaxID=57062 RepID=A0ABD1EUF2_HYPHA
MRSYTYNKSIVILMFILTFLNVLAKKAPGHVAPPIDYDPDPPKYEYGYRIQEDKITYGKDEQRDGIYAQGRYYIENGTESSQSVKYFADDWGYHPVVEYSNTGPHSKSSTNFVLGDEAIKLKDNQKSIPQDPSDSGTTENLVKNDLFSQEYTLNPSDGNSTSIDPANHLITEKVSNEFFLIQPEIVSQHDPDLQRLNERAEPQIEDRELIVNADPQINKTNQQPIFYYVQPEEQQIKLNSPLIDLATISVDQPIFLQPFESISQEDPNFIQYFNTLPQPEALITDEHSTEDAPEINNELETAALIKRPNNLIHNRQYPEFGAKLNPKQPQMVHPNKLLESIRNLVTGTDVLDINAAVSESEQQDFETNTLNSLLEKYVSPVIISSTTASPPNLLKEPIVVADSESELDSKPVTEQTEETKEYSISTARSTLATTASGTETSILVTPRPVSSKFLAPITAGVQLQQVQEQIFGDSKTVETHSVKNEGVDVQVQRTIPFYLGMFEYPSGLDASSQNATEEDSSVEQKAINDVELGKTLLYFPEQLPHAKALRGKNLHQEIPYGTKLNKVSKQTFLQNENSLNAEESESQREDVKVEKKPIEIVSGSVQVPVEVTKYVDRPYPVEVPVPVPQPYPVEKVIQKIIKEPYPVEVKVPVHVPVPQPIPVEKIIERKVPVPYYVEKPVEKIVEKPIEKIIERKIPVPYYIEKPTEKQHFGNRPFHVQQPLNSQPFLLKIPGLYSKQKYSSLVQNLHAPSNVHFQYSHWNKQPIIGFNNVPQLPHAPLNNQYLPLIKQNSINQPLKKLSLLVFPGVNIANLPPITKNLPDFHKNLYRQSNNKLNNGYLPPISDQTETSSSNNGFSIKKPDEHLGLIPPKRSSFGDERKHRSARAHFDDSSIRLEYGFMPPLRPSIEIDELGRPIDKSNKN